MESILEVPARSVCRFRPPQILTLFPYASRDVVTPVRHSTQVVGVCLRAQARRRTSLPQALPPPREAAAAGRAARAGAVYEREGGGEKELGIGCLMCRAKVNTCCSLARHSACSEAQRSADCGGRTEKPDRQTERPTAPATQGAPNAPRDPGQEPRRPAHPRNVLHQFAHRIRRRPSEDARPQREPGGMRQFRRGSMACARHGGGSLSALVAADGRLGRHAAAQQSDEFRARRPVGSHVRHACHDTHGGKLIRPAAA